MAHAVMALLLQVIFAQIWDNWWIGAAFGAALFIGREHAQAEYRWIAEYSPDGRRASMPWWGGFDPRVWRKADALLDWLVPLAAVITLALMKG